MKIDATLTKDVDRTREAAAELEAAGYDGLWVGETKHDPFLESLQAADATERVTIGTAVAIAFGRSPMTLASTGFDLARYTRGRFVLGLGSQVKPHIERRFSMPWSHPAPRMRELVLAMRAIWRTWQEGEPLDFRGDFYTHTLMTPFFSPPPHEWGPPPVYLAGVGERMTETAGEVGDGFFFHPFTTDRYLREVTLPRSGAAAPPLATRVSKGSPSPVRRSRAPAATTTSWRRRSRGPRTRSPSTRRRRRTGPCSSCTDGVTCSRS